MNSYELRYYLRGLKLKTYVGVYAIDQLKYIKASHFAIIFNNMPSSTVGMHWCAIIKKQGKKKLDFFDSLGKDITYYGDEVYDFISRHCTEINYLTKNVQNFHSNTCGKHCCFFITKRYNGLSFKNLMRLYSNNTKQNDKMVISYMKHIKIPKFSQCTRRCFKDPFVNVCFQKSNSYYHFKEK
jgi:hypothetical protein